MLNAHDCEKPCQLPRELWGDFRVGLGLCTRYLVHQFVDGTNVRKHKLIREFSTFYIVAKPSFYVVFRHVFLGPWEPFHIVIFIGIELKP